MTLLRAFGLSVCMAAVMAGCASSPPSQESTDPAMSSLDKAIEKSRVELPEFTASSTAKPKPPKEKGATISLDYAGEARTLLARLAAANERQFRVLGPQPHLPLFVIVNAKEADFVEVLRDIGEQFGERADLVLTDKAIEVHYRVR